MIAVQLQCHACGKGVGGHLKVLQLSHILGDTSQRQLLSTYSSSVLPWGLAETKLCDICMHESPPSFALQEVVFQKREIIKCCGLQETENHPYFDRIRYRSLTMARNYGRKTTGKTYKVFKHILWSQTIFFHIFIILLNALFSLLGL